MPVLLQYLLKLSISLAVVYLFYRIALRRLTFYQLNRWYLMGYSLLCFFLPLFNVYQFMEPGQQQGGIVQLIPMVGNLSMESGKSAANYNDLPTILLMLFFAGVTVMLVRFSLQYLSLLRMHTKARLLADQRVRLYNVDEPILPFSFGRSVFINAAQHSEAELEEIIRHEMVHVRQAHTLDILFSELLVITNWFNPFAWLLRRSIRQNLEFIADHQVLAHGLDPRQYQYLLLKVVGQPQFSIGTHLNFSALKTRIAMMNTIRSARVHLVKFAFAVPLAAVLLLAFRKEKPSKKETLQQAPVVTLQQATLSSVPDTVPVRRSENVPATEPNDKGYILTIADNHGECIVIIKNRQGKLVKAMPLTEWNENSERNEATYGEIPPPPPPHAPVPPIPPIAGAPAAPAKVSTSPAPGDPVEPAPPPVPAAPAAPRLPANVASMHINNEKVTIRLKNGTKEEYDLNNPVQRAAFEKKYGKIADPEKPAVPERPDNPSESMQPTPAPAADLRIRTLPNTPAPLIMLDGKEVTMQELERVDKGTIGSMEVIKGEHATSKYGEKGKYGVIEVRLKKVPATSGLFNPFNPEAYKKDKC